MHESLIMLINVPELADKQVTSVKMYECCRQLNGVNLARCFAVCVRRRAGETSSSAVRAERDNFYFNVISPS